jgi:nucleoside-diphosphate-sugar epimerase
MKRILITGGNGFVGTRLIRRLAAAGHEVWAIVRRVPEPKAPQVHWLVQDLAADHWTIDLPARIDAVIHLAQSPHYRDFPNQAKDIYAVAAGATMKLLDWAWRAGAKHFVLTSTGGLYGVSKRPALESDALPEQYSQLGFYFAAKRASELIALQYSRELATIVLRCFFVYGAAQSPKMLMPRILESVRAGRPVQLQGDDGMVFNPIHVDDAVRAVEACLKLAESRIINVAGPEVTSLRAVAESLGQIVGREPVFEINNTVAPNHLVADIKRMESALGTPRIGIDSGLSELCGALQPVQPPGE